MQKKVENNILNIIFKKKHAKKGCRKKVGECKYYQKNKKRNY